MHHDDKVEGDDSKPHIILHYNECKSGVDNMDKLVGTFSCKRKTNRWPMAVFFNMTDVAGVGALVIWLYNNPDVGESGPQWPPVHSGHIVIPTHSAYRLACDVMSAISYLAVYTPLLCFWREVRLELKYRVLLVSEVHKFIFAFPV